MKLRLIFFAGIVLLLACNSKPKTPKDILPKEKMIEILVDFQLVESAVLQKQNHQQDVKFYTNYYYDYILKKHKVSRKEFKHSLDYYKNNMEEMDNIYQEILGRLSKLKVESKK